MTANTWYHLVAYNTDSNPISNYVSHDDLWDGQTPSTKVRNPVIPDQQLAVLYTVGGSWATAENRTAIVDFAYADGTHFGMGYMEISSTADNTYMHAISGSHMVRQTFTPVSDISVSALFVSLWRRSGSSPITATLTSSQGTVSSTNNSAAMGGFASANELYDQDFVAFNLPATLKAGVTYYLELAAPSDTVYMISGLRDGNAAGNGFDKATVFADGWAQYTTDGSNWIGLGHLGNPE